MAATGDQSAFLLKERGRKIMDSTWRVVLPTSSLCQLQPVVTPRNKAPLRPETVGIPRDGGSFHVRPFKPRPPRREEVSRNARLPGRSRTLVGISHTARASSVPIRPLSSVRCHSLPQPQPVRRSDAPRSARPQERHLSARPPLEINPSCSLPASRIWPTQHRPPRA